MPTFGKFLLFFCSWWPAYAMIALITWEGHHRLPQIALAVTVASIPIYFIIEKAIFSAAEHSVKIKEASRRDENILMYVLAYLPPFFSTDFSKIGADLAIALFYVLFAITYVKLDLYYLNPMFVLRSYKTFSVIAESGEEYVALVKSPRKLHAGDTVRYRGRDQVLLING